MCGRFTLTADKEEIEKHLQVDLFHYTPRYNIAPSQPVLSIISNGEQKKAGYLRWGLVPSWAKDPKIGYKMINARGETIHEKSAFKRLFERRRCLIVADGFYEWKRTEQGKKPYRITVHEGIFTFAGLWDRWIDAKKGSELTTCTIITTEPNKRISDIHDRMPVILHRRDWDRWLDKTTHLATLKTLLHSYPAEEMDAYEVSTIVNSPKNESVDCIQSLT
ncbi:SOS response-associated peptidase [Halalkalibacter sp. APA_J-10(15)]|uniref:SOS response-associated peptidase n=1 Tax=Halalkalibacter sp. APA_J-10(15) TaxID=2933805 RepID=UPI001FF54078|nr:SOS response-associated peptidase [Halalkalibacter sp. APA_J-10(15)]MCK0470904.1 SOS response-associated peptidase [Halalkalibacter sp. APA_J-10(15)]